MIAFEEAQEVILKTSHCLDIEAVDLHQALGRVLASDGFSDMDLPPFNKSAVDGYACKRMDLLADLKVLEVIPAGLIPKYEICEGECSKIMTGAMLPAGADTVFMVEDAVEIHNQTVRFGGKATSKNYTIKGEDIHKGDKVLTKGTKLRPQDIAILASAGIAQPLVFRKPMVGIISTGSELVEPNCIPAESQIRNSNAMQLHAQATKAGCDVKYYGIALDNETDTFLLLKKATDECDIVLLSGGVSAGDFDFVPKVIQQCGFTILFRKIAVQPGKPLVYATAERKYIIGLPGNPVSSFVQFEVTVRTLIEKLTGENRTDRTFEFEMGYDFSRNKSDRKLFIPVFVTSNGLVMPVEYNGSAHIHSYLNANGIAQIETGISEVLKGSKVHVRLI